MPSSVGNVHVGNQTPAHSLRLPNIIWNDIRVLLGKHRDDESGAVICRKAQYDNGFRKHSEPEHRTNFGIQARNHSVPECGFTNHDGILFLQHPP